jgi:hypothetical protein
MTEITLVLVTHSWNGKTTLKIKGRYTSKVAAKKAEKKLLSSCFNHRYYGLAKPDYRILDPKQLAALVAELDQEKSKRRKAAIAKAAKTRKENGTKPHFILCPTCNAKSKKLFSEMGGVQTRHCKNGHDFEVDTFFGFETNKRRVERTDRPLYTGPMSYPNYVYGKFKDNPEGK